MQKDPNESDQVWSPAHPRELKVPCVRTVLLLVLQLVELVENGT